MFIYGILLGLTATAFVLSFIFLTGHLASWILGFLTLVPLYLMFRHRRMMQRGDRKGKSGHRVRPAADRGKVLPFPDAGNR
jgi:1,4-dihydroxy-2-naphthoate octaprenyltransferase